MSFAGLLNQTISVKNPTSTRDKHGNLGLGSATSISARFERTNKIIVTKDREREPIHGIAAIGPNDTVEIGAQITYDGDQYRVMTKADAVNRDGSIHHVEVMTQLWSWT